MMSGGVNKLRGGGVEGLIGRLEDGKIGDW